MNNNNSCTLRAQGSSTHISLFKTEVPAIKLKSKTHKQQQKSKRGRKGEKYTAETATVFRLAQMLLAFLSLAAFEKKYIVSPPV